MRFLFCSFSSPGFLFSLVGLALELRRRGHEITFVSGPLSQPILGAAHLQRIPRGDRDGPSFNVSKWYGEIENAIDVKHIEYAIRKDPPEAIVTHHLCLSALIVSDRQNLPVGVMGPFTYLFPPTSMQQPTLGVESVRRREWRLNEMIRVLNMVRSLFRLRPQPARPDDHALLGDVYMLRTTPPVESNIESLPRQVHAVGPCAWEPEIGEEPEAAKEAWYELQAGFASPNAPLLYVHNGRTFNGPTFWPQLVEGLASVPIQVVGSVGRMDADVGPLPPNFLVRDHVPQALVMPHAQAVLAAGHSSVVIGTLMHGLPSVLVPCGVETPDNAERLVATGSALCLSIDDLTSDTLREAVGRTLVDDEMRQHARALQRSLQAMASFEGAATLIETMAARRAPVFRSNDMPFTEYGE